VAFACVNAKMEAKAPIDATRACAMWVQVVIRSVIGVMSGPAARKACEPPVVLKATLGTAHRQGNPGCLRRRFLPVEGELVVSRSRNQLRLRSASVVNVCG
jgi:hypothetical protein